MCVCNDPELNLGICGDCLDGSPSLEGSRPEWCAVRAPELGARGDTKGAGAGGAGPSPPIPGLAFRKLKRPGVPGSVSSDRRSRSVEVRAVRSGVDFWNGMVSPNMKERKPPEWIVSRKPPECIVSRTVSICEPAPLPTLRGFVVGVVLIENKHDFATKRWMEGERVKEVRLQADLDDVRRSEALWSVEGHVIHDGGDRIPATRTDACGC